MLERGLTMCPDSRLHNDAPAVFYRHLGVFKWDPNMKESTAVVVKQIDALTRKMR